MATRLIFTLGATLLSEAEYRMDGASVTTRFSSLATRKFYDDRARREGLPPMSEAHVLVTPETEKSPLLEDLRREWEGGLVVKRAPKGGTAEELWELFEVIESLVRDGDRLVLDITSGLRSMPIVSLLVASYLKAARAHFREAQERIDGRQSRHSPFK